MPVRSSDSSVLKWPDADRVQKALTHWAQTAAEVNPDLRRVGYFGSYARGDWGPGSDLDVVLVLERSDRPFRERGADWDLTGLPVPAQVLVYDLDEWEDLQERGGRFATVLAREARWVLER